MLKTIIGLEIHAQLQTNSKAFCSCSVNSKSDPNTNVCPICTGQPGTLPRLNREMVEMTIKTAIAFDCRINNPTSFDRKNYFSPDMPKNYQITQFFNPIAQNGVIEILTEKRKKKLNITEIHMEEDSARTICKADDVTGTQKNYLDFNRSGVPLLEIVTAPKIASPKEAVECFESIRSTLVYLDVCDGHMEDGSIRCDANISIEDTKSGIKSPRVEIKNLNSFKSIERALIYEEQLLKQQLGLKSPQEAVTKDWDDRLKCTIKLRDKENLCDYRYFPEPDIPFIEITDREINRLESEIPELPINRLERFFYDYEIRFDLAKALINNRPLASFFESAMNISKTNEMKHLIIRDVKGYLNQTGKTIDQTQLTPEKLYEFLKNIKTGRISAATTQKILKILCETSKTVNTIIEEENLIKIDDRQSLEAILAIIIKENEEQYEAYKYGKKELLKWFIGQMIKQTKGRADPKLIIQIIKERMGD